MRVDDVVIIGAGPSGLFAAAELARHGVGARLVERSVRPHHESRATAIQPGTLEILDSVGLLAPFLEASEHIRGSRVFGPDRSELRAMSLDGVDCRCRFQCSLPQYETERLLESRLVSLGGAVERGVTATRVEAGPDGARVELAHADGRVETVHAAFVVGAGGAHSVTRESMHEPLGGTTYRGHFLVADVAMAGPFPRDEVRVVCGTAGFVMLAPLPGGRWISFQDLEEDVVSLAADEVMARIAARLDGQARPASVVWFAPFRMHRRIVSRLSDGRRFLIGDAAHLSSPFGGEGLNAGLHDGYDLAWKLALVARGRAPRSLLDAYAVERAIADRHVLEVSDQVHRAIVDMADTVRARRTIPAAAVDPLAAALLRNARAMIDVDYAGSPLVADRAPDGSVAPRPGQRYPDWTRLAGPSHHLLLFGPVADAESVDGSPGDGPATWTSLATRRSTPPARASREAAES
jgi:2-polyprenyl-6-methoxyphenol hydroxylase-like FAD-dependent oxidoreductase